MKKALVFIFFIIFSLTNLAQEKRAITVDDLWNMKRIGSYDVSPDAKKIVFSLTSYSMEKNTGQTDVWIINTDGSGSKKIIDNASSPNFYNGGANIHFSRKGQIFTSDLKGNKQTQLTDLYSGVSGAELSIDESMLLFSSHVYAECETQECNEKKDNEREESKVKAEIFTELMYRHWNDWRGPKISHLFLYDL